MVGLVVPARKDLTTCTLALQYWQTKFQLKECVPAAQLLVALVASHEQAVGCVSMALARVWGARL